MVPPDAVALSLRFRGPEVSHAAPDVAAFVGRRRTTDAPERATAEPDHAVGVVPGREPLPAQAPIVVFFQHAAYGIPAFDDPRVPMLALPDTSSWCVRPTVFGYLAQVPPRRPLRPRSRVSWIAAACLPLVMPWTAHAAPKESPAVQRPARPSIPDAPGSPAAPSDVADAPDGTEPDIAEPEPTPEPEPEPELTVDPPPASSFGDLAPRLSEADQATLDAAWEGVDGFDVDLELKGGSTMRGRVGAVQRDTFTLIRHEDGAVVVLPKSNVATLRVHMPGPIPSKTGTGPLVGGIVLTVIATPVFISGLTFLGLCPSCTYLHLPMILIGGAGLGAGIPLTIRGSRQRQEFQRAITERRLTMAVGRSRDGWTGGLRFRF